MLDNNIFNKFTFIYWTNQYSNPGQAFSSEIRYTPCLRILSSSTKPSRLWKRVGHRTDALTISPVLKESVDDVFDELVSSVTDDSDCYDAIQAEMHLGPFSGPIPLKNWGDLHSQRAGHHIRRKTE